jgi:hypothetical protein
VFSADALIRKDGNLDWADKDRKLGSSPVMIRELSKTKEITGKCVCECVCVCAQAEGQGALQKITKLIVRLPFLHMHLKRSAYQAQEFLQCTVIGDDIGFEDATLGTRYENIYHLFHQRNSKIRRQEGTP